MHNSLQAPFMISGPSGVGKTYLERYLTTNYNFQRILSTTTRPQRTNEINGKDYEFLTEQQYKKFEHENAFVTSLFNLNAHYGIRKELVNNILQQNKIPICVLVPQIIQKFVQNYPDTIAVYLLPENNDLLIKRMQLRGDSPELIQQRTAAMQTELEEYQKTKKYYKAELMINEKNFNQTVTQILQLTAAHKL